MDVCVGVCQQLCLLQVSEYNRVQFQSVLLASLLSLLGVCWRCSVDGFTLRVFNALIEQVGPPSDRQWPRECREKMLIDFTARSKTDRHCSSKYHMWHGNHGFGELSTGYLMSPLCRLDQFWCVNSLLWPHTAFHLIFMLCYDSVFHQMFLFLYKNLVTDVQKIATW